MELSHIRRAQRLRKQHDSTVSIIGHKKKPTKTNIYTWYCQVPATPVCSGTNKPQTVLDIQGEPRQTTTTTTAPEDEEAPLALSASHQLTAGAATSPVPLILHLFGTEQEASRQFRVLIRLQKTRLKRAPSTDKLVFSLEKETLSRR